MAQFVSYSGMGGMPIYYQPSMFAPEPSYDPIYGYGMWQRIGGGNTYQKPSTTPVASNIVSGYGLEDAGEGMYYYPTADKYFSGEKFYTKSGTQYSPYEGDVKGFNLAADTGIYSPSQAYLSSINQPVFSQFATQQAPLQSLGYNPAMSNLYNPATSNIYQTGTSLLSSPTASGSYGAGRYLGNNGLLGFNFSAPQTAATGE